ncbi:Histone acetyltransferase HAC5 [Hondaea fermentalgiana]|uniref:histone acetyltransferase n=1 Tax=Hondaea fermentalgiana TaxID=2315210 RepID=A0A2R5G0C5_9STRA|nr:Histone acetyltransferase HAC5 [Hondaea fermentalgiana]|eukprot:GBG24486.1 Histone acetyltransferase HAC5 [Hondaea fermentalgiana]
MAPGPQRGTEAGVARSHVSQQVQARAVQQQRATAPPGSGSQRTAPQSQQQKQQMRPPPTSNGTWRTDPQADVEPRRYVIQQIVSLLESCKPKAFARRQEKLIDLARRLEVALYKQSKSKEEYMDPATLRQRVRELAKASTAQQQQQIATKSGAGMHPTAAAQQQAQAMRRAAAVNGQQPQQQQQQQQPVYTASAASANHGRAVPGTAGDLRLKVKQPVPPGQQQLQQQHERSSTSQHDKDQILKQRQQRLLLLRHASRCQNPEGTCKVTELCARMKSLWKHISKCKDPRCPEPHCVSSRYVLSHYHRCVKEDCPVCKPVRIISANQRNQQAARQHEQLQQVAPTGGANPIRRPGTSADAATMQQRSHANMQHASRQQQHHQQQLLLRQQQQQQQQQMAMQRSRAPYRSQGMTKEELAKYRAQFPNAIDPAKARHCKSGTGPSLPFSLQRTNVEKHIESLRVERLQPNVRPLLRKLIEHKSNKGIYNAPVDWKAMNIPDYPRIIKNPMDLGTIRKRLDTSYYKTLEQFKADVVLTFENAMAFNPPENEYHTRAKDLLKVAVKEFPAIQNKIERNGRPKNQNCQLCHQSTCEQCPLCERGCIPFQPKLLFCSGTCGKRIQPNSVYYTGVGYNYCWCSDCYDKARSGVLTVNGQSYNKSDLTKKKNNELYGEPWVSCDKCDRWVHQICALFNSRKNSLNSSQDYICPLCLIEESKLGEQERKAEADAKAKAGPSGAVKKEEKEQPKPEKPKQDAKDAKNEKPAVGDDAARAKGKYKHFVLPAGKRVPSAKELDQTRLGIFLEKWVRNSIREFRDKERVRKPGIADEDLGPGADKLHIRVLSNFDEECKVKPFVKRLIPEYPDAFPFRSRCIFLFQELDGVDVLFFAMFVQEYGSDCPDPNRRKVYIAYLDSVYYFQPRRLRTTVYHELLLGYLEYMRRDGMTSAYIWACPPPNKRDDYIIHCHPEDQRVQTPERLRKWYHDMITQGSGSRIFMGSCAMFEEHFEGSARANNKKKSKSKSKKRTSKSKSKSKSSKKGKKSSRKGTTTRRISGAAAAAQAAAAAKVAAEEAAKAEAEAAAAAASGKTNSADGDNKDGDGDDDEENDTLGMLPDMPDLEDDEEDEDANTEAKATPEDGVPLSDADKAKAMAEAAGVTFLTPANGVCAGDDRMLAEDLERRKANKLAAAGHLPYFEGDYWPQEAEELAKERARQKKKESENNGGRSKRKRRRNGEEGAEGGKPDGKAGNGKAADTDKPVAELAVELTAEEAAEARVQLMQRLAQQLEVMKDDFLVVKMSHECTRCGKYLLRGRWECRHPTCLEDSGFNKSCPFALCNDCYVLETKRPKEQQHGGGCVADGPDGKPKSAEEEADKEAGKDQTVIDVNIEYKRKEKERKEKEAKEKAEREAKEKAKREAAEQEKKKTKVEEDASKPSTSDSGATDAAGAAAVTTATPASTTTSSADAKTSQPSANGDATVKTEAPKSIKEESTIKSVSASGSVKRSAPDAETKDTTSAAPATAKAEEETKANGVKSEPQSETEDKPSKEKAAETSVEATASTTEASSATAEPAKDHDKKASEETVASESDSKPTSAPTKEEASEDKDDKQAMKRQKISETDAKTTATSSSASAVKKEEGEFPVKKEALSAEEKVKNQDQDKDTKMSEAGEKIAESKAGAAVTVAEKSSDDKDGKANESKEDKPKTKEEREAEAKAKAEAEVKMKKQKEVEEARKRKELLAEWEKQSIECTRAPLPSPAAEDHILHYVDENLPIQTPDHDVIMKNHLLESRHAFLSLCTGNRYQFDQQRRAKHSTMMVLYHLHNPDAPAHLYTCMECHNDILSGKRYHCDVCNGGDYDLCVHCKRHMGRHEHMLTPFVVTRGVQAETTESQRMQRVQEMQRARQHSLTLFLEALVHSSQCNNPECSKAPCKKMKDLLKHRMTCEVRVRGGCEICRRVLCLVQMHARNCHTPNCRVPHCEDLKVHIHKHKQQMKQHMRQNGRPATEQELVQQQRNLLLQRQRQLQAARQNAQLQQQQQQQRQQQAARGGVRSARGRGHRSGSTGAAAQAITQAGQQIQATVVEGSGGTKIKIRPTNLKPSVPGNIAPGATAAPQGPPPASSRASSRGQRTTRR